MTERVVDKDALLAKYRSERDKRLRAEGNAQYRRVADVLGQNLKDPYTPVAPRPPKTDHVTFAFIGGGFAGLVTGARLVEAGVQGRAHRREGRGFRRHLVLEPLPRRAVRHRVHGLYAPPRRDRTSGRPRSMPTHRKSWSSASGSGASSAFTTTRFFIRRSKGSVGTTPRRSGPSEPTGATLSPAKFVGLGTGPLHIPKLPGIPGIETFKGHAFPHQSLGPTPIPVAIPGAPRWRS